MTTEAHNRIEFLCRNSDVYTLSSSARADQNFFDIGSEIPPMEFAKEIRIAGISDFGDPNGGSGGNGSGGDDSQDQIVSEGNDEGVPQWIIYAGAALIAILLIVIVVWKCYKCSYRRNA